MTTIELRFPAHRFHGTPWGRHVNEGVPEWPPSPYRLLRSLFDAWKRKRPDLPETRVEEVLRALASEPPRFALPKGTASHTRSYLNSNTEDPTDKSLIFDAFVALDPGRSCYVTWPNVTFSAEQRVVFGELLQSLNFVGRSESWIDASLFDGEVDAPIRCEPLGATEESGEAIPVACPRPPAEYAEKRPWLDAITYTTTEFLKDRRSLPPAMQMVQYVRPKNALLTHVPRAAKKHATGVQAVLLGLDAPVLPLITGTVELAEQIRVRLMGIHKRLVGNPARVSRVFSGKDPAGLPLTDHKHLFILPLSSAKKEGRIDRVLLFTRGEGGLDSEEIRAILQLHSLYRPGSDESIRVVATWKGRFDDEQVRPFHTQVASVTPFVITRFWRRGRGEPEDFLKAEVRRECGNHGLPEVASIELLSEPPGLFEWVEFRRNRKDDAPRPGFGFRLEFTKPVNAPFSLGYGCHFGLGQFDAAG